MLVMGMATATANLGFGCALEFGALALARGATLHGSCRGTRVCPCVSCTGAEIPMSGPQPTLSHQERICSPSSMSDRLQTPPATQPAQETDTPSAILMGLIYHEKYYDLSALDPIFIQVRHCYPCLWRLSLTYPMPH